MKFLLALIALIFIGATSAGLIEQVCSMHNWDQRCCRCIVQKESGGNPKANNGQGCLGLFQVRQSTWGGRCGNLYDATANTKCAIMIYKQAGNKWRDWDTKGACGC